MRDSDSLMFELHTKAPWIVHQKDRRNPFPNSYATVGEERYKQDNRAYVSLLKLRCGSELAQGLELNFASWLIVGIATANVSCISKCCLGDEMFNLTSSR